MTKLFCQIINSRKHTNDQPASTVEPIYKKCDRMVLYNSSQLDAYIASESYDKYIKNKLKDLVVNNNTLPIGFLKRVHHNLT